MLISSYYSMDEVGNIIEYTPKKKGRFDFEAERLLWDGQEYKSDTTLSLEEDGHHSSLYGGGIQGHREE